MVIQPLQLGPLQPPPFDGRGSYTWRDAVGRPIARATSADGWSWMRLEGLATYRYRHEPQSGSLSCFAAPDEGVPWAAVVDQYLRTVVVFALQSYGYCCLHAAAVEGRAGVALLAGPSGVGKTTLALELGRRGLTVLADDAAVVEASPPGGGPALRPLPFEPYLRPDAAGRHGLRERRLITPPDAPLPLGERRPLTALVFLERKGDGSGSPPALTEASGTEAFEALLARAFLAKQVEALREPRVVRELLLVAGRVPAYTLSYGDDVGAVTRAATEVEKLVSA